MKISIITAIYNSAGTVEDTVKSVLSQDYEDFEHIIIDGKSTDNVLEIIESYREKYGDRLKVISEKDNGLYDAMNKGISIASGDIVGILNSDDALADSSVLSDIAKTFESTGCDASYGDLVFLDYETFSKKVRFWKSKKGNYKLGWHPPHPTLYLKKEVYEKFGKFDLSFKIAADYDFMLRIMKGKIKLSYIEKVLVKMRAGGISTNGISGYIESLKESHKALKNNRIKCALFVDFIRTVKTLLQMVLK